MRKEHRTIAPISIRDLSEGDEAGLRAMFGTLSGETIHKRLHMPFPRVPEPMLDYLMGHGGGGSLVAVAESEIVGHALYAEEPVAEAEVAVVVEDGWQSGGIGKLLPAGLARKAAGRGVESFTAAALGENRRVLGLVEAVFAGARHTLREGRLLRHPHAPPARPRVGYETRPEDATRRVTGPERERSITRTKSQRAATNKNT